ncbi:hypothetical protein BSF38_01892 [Paludisphaera borealis]|uniref:Dockerin domain-containing protein n=1 Tax=Paludisphaera borealis TaxID=1387353 RepID=A0A1U7CNA7_9BACT|nr:hypothetical protein BSF38_01892 [Paludisphaera borealis]
MARSNSRGIHPSLEGLEPRLALSASPPANVIGVNLGTVASPHQVSRTSVAVAGRNITPHKRATLFGLFVEPEGDSSLKPRIVAASADQGRKLPLKQGRVARSGANPTSVAFTKTNQSGDLTTSVAGAAGTTGLYWSQTTLVGDVNGDGEVNFADLQAFAPTYMSSAGGSKYVASADFNQNGVINLYDAKALLHNLAPLTRNIPLSVSMHLAPADQAHYAATTTSGASTLHKVVTIIGRTTPGSLIIEDNHTSRLPGGTQTYSFTGPAHATDANGFFSIQTTNEEGLNNNDFLILDPFGHQLIRAFPIFWIPFAAGRV